MGYSWVVSKIGPILLTTYILGIVLYGDQRTVTYHICNWASRASKGPGVQAIGPEVAVQLAAYALGVVLAELAVLSASSTSSVEVLPGICRLWVAFGELNL